jgi:hypothetical protein
MNKLEKMDGILKDSKDYQGQLTNSKDKLEQMKNQHCEQEDALKRLREEVESLKCNSVQSMDTETEWQAIKDRAAMLEEVEKDRNALKDQLCRMVGVEDLLRKLKKRADEADLMEQEIVRLKRELQKSGKTQSDSRPTTKETSKILSCPNCVKISDDLESSEAALAAEIKRSNEIEAERNFLRQKTRTIDVLEAELILYKVSGIIHFRFNF